MKTFLRFLFFGFLILHSAMGNTIRGSFYDRMLAIDRGNMCSDNPVCVAEGRLDGACCPNANNEYLSCCNRACSAHSNCAQLSGFCCPTLDNVELNCCNHQPALLPSSAPSGYPTRNPSAEPTGYAEPSYFPSSVPSNSPSKSPSVSTPGPSSSAPSEIPSSAPLAPDCSSSAFFSTSSVKPLTTDGGTIVYDLQYLPSASAPVYAQVYLRGDYGQEYEFMEFNDETSTLIGVVDPDEECSITYNKQTFVIAQVDFNAWIVDGTVTFTLNSPSAVGTFCANNDAYIVLCYETSTPDNPTPSPSTSPSSAPSPHPSWGPSSAPSATPSSEPSLRPSNSPSSEPSGTPSGSPSQAPSQSPTIPEDRDGGGSPSPPIFLSPKCQDVPGCAVLGLQGVCCPAQNGQNLDCCTSGISGGGTGQASCAANSRCAGLSGNCCPTVDGVQLACCD